MKPVLSVHIREIKRIISTKWKWLLDRGLMITYQL